MLHLATDEHISVFSPGQSVCGVLEQRPPVKSGQLRLTLRCCSADGHGQKSVLWQQMQPLDARLAQNVFAFILPKPAFLSSQGPLFSLAWELLAERCLPNARCEHKTLEILLLAPDLLAVEKPQLKRLQHAIPMQGRPAWRFFLPKYCLGLQQHGHSFRLSWYWLSPKSSSSETAFAKTAELQLWQALRYRSRWQKQLWRTLPFPLENGKNNILLTLPTAWPLPLRTPYHRLFYRLRLDNQSYHWPQR
jgi:hypothetical protein